MPGTPLAGPGPSTAVLGPLKLQCLNRIDQQIARAVRGVDLGQLCNHCLPGSSVALGGGGGGGCNHIFA